MANLCVEGKKKAEKLEDEELESFSYALHIAHLFVFPLSLQTATELGVFDVLQKADPNAELSAKQIASQLSCNNPEAPSMLDRILSLLASHSVLNCSVLQDGPQNIHKLYSITPVASFFARNSDGVSLGPLLALQRNKALLASWSHLKDAIQEGGALAFDRVHGSNLFQYLSLNSRLNQVFNTAMINHTTIVMKMILERYKGFEGINRVVDVAGGLGINSNLITTKYPHIKAVNFDLPHVLRDAPSYPGVEHVGGDMFQSVPKGDAIFMKWILHDWSDEQCLKLLKNCYAAIPDDGKVIVVEGLLHFAPENNHAWKSISELDVLMMIQCPGGKERSEQEFLQLAIAAGFSGVRYECHVNTYCVMEFFK